MRSSQSALVLEMVSVNGAIVAICEVVRKEPVNPEMSTPLKATFIGLINTLIANRDKNPH
jgi:hypothetical protein